jgi:hypothetical protein
LSHGEFRERTGFWIMHKDMFKRHWSALHLVGTGKNIFRVNSVNTQERRGFGRVNNRVCRRVNSGVNKRILDVQRKGRK